MELVFEVGTTEKHEVVYSWDQMWGRESLAVDGTRVLKTVQILSFRLVKVRQATVGENEKHQVRVEKRRKLFVAGFRPQIVTAFVDGKKVAEGVSTVSPKSNPSIIVLGIAFGVIVVACIAVVVAVAAALLAQGPQ